MPQGESLFCLAPAASFVMERNKEIYFLQDKQTRVFIFASHSSRGNKVHLQTTISYGDVILRPVHISSYSSVDSVDPTGVLFIISPLCGKYPSALFIKGTVSVSHGHLQTPLHSSGIRFICDDSGKCFVANFQFIAYFPSFIGIVYLSSLVYLVKHGRYSCQLHFVAPLLEVIQQCESLMRQFRNQHI